MARALAERNEPFPRRGAQPSKETTVGDIPNKDNVELIADLNAERRHRYASDGSNGGTLTTDVS